MIHFMPHSHIDPGWVDDVDTVYDIDARRIIGTMATALESNPELRFNFADIYMLSRWWSVTN